MNPSLPAEGFGAETGALVLSLRAALVDSTLASELDLEPKDARGTLADLTLVELDLRATVAILPRMAVDLLVPVKVGAVRSVRILGPWGAQTSAQRSTIAGFGDSELSLRLRAVADANFTLDLRAGLTIPLGLSLPDPAEAFARDAAGARSVVGGPALGPLAPTPAIALGRGATELVVGAQARRLLGPGVALIGFGYARSPLTRTALGVQNGGRISGGIGVELASERLRAGLIPALYHEGPDRWLDGVIVAGTGRTDLAITGSLTLFASAPWPLELSLTLPLTLAVSAGAPHSGAATLALLLSHAF